MGKGQIISGGTDGQYNVKLTLHREHLLKKIVELGGQITALETRISGMDDGPAKDAVTFQKNALVKRKEYYENNMPDDPIVEAWCADLTEDLSGDVGTIEIPGERGEINIQPGYEGNAAFDNDRDGQLQPAIASKSAAAVFYNLAMLPGWQKWMPNFRYGTITFIDSVNNTCNVNLDPALSFQHDLNINYVSKLSDVLIEYMECDCAAFDVGDEVIIQFTSVNTQTEENWATGKVIGFKDNPKTCSFSFKLTRGDDTLITEAGGLFSGFTVLNSSEDVMSISAPVYDVEKETWSFLITSEHDPDGYFISYNCTDGAETQYPYRYKTADKLNSGDLTSIGSYEDIIPYWKVEPTTTNIDEIEYNDVIWETTTWDPPPPAWEKPAEFVDGIGKLIPGHMFLAFTVEGAKFEKYLIVKSSIPYRVVRHIDPTDGKLVTWMRHYPDLRCNDGGGSRYYYELKGQSEQPFSIHYEGGGLDYTHNGTLSQPVDTIDYENIEGFSVEGTEHIITITDDSSHDIIAHRVCWDDELEGQDLDNWTHFDTNISSGGMISITAEYDF